MQYLSSTIDFTDNFTLFKISSEEKNKELIMKKQKLCKEVAFNILKVALNVLKVAFNVLKVIKTVSFNMSFSFIINSLSVNDNLKIKEVIEYDQEHIDLSSVINFINITQS